MKILMKTIVAVTIIGLFNIQSIQAQTGSSEMRTSYQAWISTYETSRPIAGVLYEIEDSSVTLSNRNFSRNGSSGKVDMTKLDVRSIDVMKLRKNGNTGRGILYGAISGLVVGGVLGILYASTVEKHEEGANNFEKSINSTASTMQIVGSSILIGIGCIGTGIGVGAIIGSAKIAIPINGSQAQFTQNKSMLKDYSVKSVMGLEAKSFSILRGTLIDIDGNAYPMVALGAQVWMAEDLKVIRYRDGSEISDLTKETGGNGRQYNWSAINDSRKICPVGWHVPSNSEWNSLFNSLGGENGAAQKLGSGFSDKGEVCQWWSSTEQGPNQAYSLYLNNATAAVMVTGIAKNSDLSVRCVRDY
jgi:F0F1-type ATP synthase membrane subunit c/vacuolar-type H+-ATPase subunit K